MQSQKKKPRQRNRPKNKVNRLQSEVQEDSKNGQSSPHPPAELEGIELKGTADNQLVTQALYESHDITRLLQRGLRAQFLERQSKDEEKSITNCHQKEPIGQLPLINKTTLSVGETQATPKAPASHKKSQKNTKNQEKTSENSAEQNAFISNLQQQMEQMMANGNPDLPQTILGNLQKLLDQAPVSDIESSDDEEEYIEYVYTPRQYFLATLCHHCNLDLCEGPPKKLLPCKRCQLVHYCGKEHMRSDEKHRQLCHALRQIAENNGGHVFHKCDAFSSDQFRSYRIVTVRSTEAILNRPLTSTEQEIILFPRICGQPNCREYRSDKLLDCEKCGQVAYCRDNVEHLPKTHERWCESYRLFKEMILFQTRFGRLDPSLPAKILKDLPGACSNTRQILNKLNFEIKDPCEYAALTQISTGPLTAWYALKLCAGLKNPSGKLTIHLIGSELEFEVNAIHKWELFFLHITPAVRELNIVFIGPELNPRNISFDQLKKTKCCRACRKAGRKVNYSFDCHLYHVYCKDPNFLQPDLVCFFNAGLYRATGYQLEDSWPETIAATANLKCPVVVTSYTEYEAPLDMTSFVQECNRHVNIALPPIVNPFGSEKPERNFISDDEAPLIFKNYYCFVVE